MFDVTTKYLASAFVDAESIEYEADNLRPLLDALGDSELSAQNLVQITQSGLKKRFRFEHIGTGDDLQLLGDRFDVTRKHKPPDGENMGDVAAFCEQAAELLSGSLDHFGRKAHRLAVVIDGLLTDLNENDFVVLADRLLNAPDLGGGPPFEWNWRIATKIERSFGQFADETNTLVHIRRARVTMSALGQPLFEGDTIGVSLDINTNPENKVARYDSDGIRAYLGEVSTWMDDLWNRTNSFMFGE